jgi:hypothetical protein
MCEILLSRPVVSAVTFIWKLVHDNLNMFFCNAEKETL